MNYTDKEIADSAQALGLSPAQLSVGRSDGSPATYSAGDLRGIRDLLQRENKGLMRLALYPQIAGDFPDEFASGRIRESGIKLYCNCLDVAVVDHNGEVLACGFIKKSFGNILQRPLKDILDSEEFTSQRQGLLKENLLPICSRCCALGYLK
jgi:radical SAM protein with 4Fe4S-binding SPASM domain